LRCAKGTKLFPETKFRINEIGVMTDAINTNIGEVLRKDAASKFCEISERTLDNWMRRGIVPYSKMPSGAVRFRKSQLIEMLATYEVGGRRGEA